MPPPEYGPPDLARNPPPGLRVGVSRNIAAADHAEPALRPHAPTRVDLVKAQPAMRPVLDLPFQAAAVEKHTPPDLHSNLRQLFQRAARVWRQGRAVRLCRIWLSCSLHRQLTYRMERAAS